MTTQVKFHTGHHAGKEVVVKITNPATGMVVSESVLRAGAQIDFCIYDNLVLTTFEREVDKQVEDEEGVDLPLTVAGDAEVSLQPVDPLVPAAEVMMTEVAVAQAPVDSALLDQAPVETVAPVVDTPVVIDTPVDIPAPVVTDAEAVAADAVDPALVQQAPEVAALPVVADVVVATVDVVAPVVDTPLAADVSVVGTVDKAPSDAATLVPAPSSSVEDDAPLVDPVAPSYVEVAVVRTDVAAPVAQVAEVAPVEASSVAETQVVPEVANQLASAAWTVPVAMDAEGAINVGEPAVAVATAAQQPLG